jgi:prepilin-type N-terminal cleavage/methylation domain-containing protein
MDRVRARTADEGFTLIEVLVSVAMIGMVMASVTAFFVNSMRLTQRQGQQQTAARLILDGVETARSFKGPAILTGRRACSVTTCTSAVASGAAAFLSSPSTTSSARMDSSDGTAALLPIPVVPQSTDYPAGATKTAMLANGSLIELDGIQFLRNYYVETCRQPTGGGLCDQTAANPVLFYRVVVAVTWRTKECPSGVCSEITPTLVSSNTVDPTFTL